jgi:hypothetical protein
MKNQISESLLNRAATIVINTNIDPIEALKQAINEEMQLADEMIEGKTERAKNVREYAMHQTYMRINKV